MSDYLPEWSRVSWDLEADERTKAFRVKIIVSAKDVTHEFYFAPSVIKKIYKQIMEVEGRGYIPIDKAEALE